MDTMSYSSLRAQLAGTLDQVNDNHKPVLVTRQNGRPAVIMSLEDYQSYEATAYLMASPANAQRLNQAINEVEAGNLVEQSLVEL
ncbi:MAG TPA: type II toxin-antitoxin system prevent-host-death family antitoxin [Oceanospirillaceae bacterium]|nr:type II toxin-antitoxin system prevent-host-death family antitoxin [Oceanospirillaceae bacterium]